MRQYASHLKFIGNTAETRFFAYCSERSPRLKGTLLYLMNTFEKNSFWALRVMIKSVGINLNFHVIKTFKNYTKKNVFAFFFIYSHVVFFPNVSSTFLTLKKWVLAFGICRISEILHWQGEGQGCGCQICNRFLTRFLNIKKTTSSQFIRALNQENKFLLLVLYTVLLLHSSCRSGISFLSQDHKSIQRNLV